VFALSYRKYNSIRCIQKNREKKRQDIKKDVWTPKGWGIYS
jgi:hypothetical protein